MENSGTPTYKLVDIDWLPGISNIKRIGKMIAVGMGIGIVIAIILAIITYLVFGGKIDSSNVLWYGLITVFVSVLVYGPALSMYERWQGCHVQQ